MNMIKIRSTFVEKYKWKIRKGNVTLPLLIDTFVDLFLTLKFVAMCDRTSYPS